MLCILSVCLWAFWLFVYVCLLVCCCFVLLFFLCFVLLCFSSLFCCFVSLCVCCRPHITVMVGRTNPGYLYVVVVVVVVVMIYKLCTMQSAKTSC